MKNIMKSFSGLMILFLAMCFMNGCKQETQYVEKTYTSEVEFYITTAEETGVTITMTTATAGAVIYYTTDGSTPTTTSTKYSKAVTTDKDITVKAIAVKDGYENSPVSSAIVSVDTNTITNTVTKYICPNCEKEYNTAEDAEACCGRIKYLDKNYTAAVTFTVEDKGKYNVEVTMNCSTEGAVIYYTTNGSTPTESSEKYEGFVTFNLDTVIKAIAVKEGMENSSVSVIRIKIKTEIQTVPSYVSPDGVLAGTYNIYHLKQKTSGGKSLVDYDLADTESSKTLEKEYTSIDDLKNVYEGFTAKALGRNDNSVYIFYDRNLITYTFEAGEEGSLTDGNKTRTLKGLYGSSFSIPVAKSDTHFFNGWFTSDNKVPETTLGLENQTFTVKWISKDDFNFNWYEIPVDAESGEFATSSSKYIYFGTFPRSVLGKDEPIIINENEEMTQGMNTYYRGNDGNWYEKVTENAYEDSYIYSDNTPVKQESADSTRYFKVEPIKWKVLTNSYNDEANLCLLLTTEILTANVPFHIKQGDRSIGAKTIYQNNYKYSTIRAYLNGKYENADNQTDYTTQNYRNNGFLQTAFPSSVISNINNTFVNNGRESAGYSENSDDEDSDCILPFICDNTTDKIFLLSTSEVGNSGYGFTDEDAKIRFITDYAKANFAYQNPKEFENKQHAGNWWLRSPCCCNYSGDGKYIGETNIANCIEYDRIFHHTHESNIGIVPALTISLPESF